MGVVAYTGSVTEEQEEPNTTSGDLAQDRVGRVGAGVPDARIGVGRVGLMVVRQAGNGPRLEEQKRPRGGGEPPQVGACLM